jgi:hypothetical protein
MDGRDLAFELTKGFRGVQAPGNTIEFCDSGH